MLGAMYSGITGMDAASEAMDVVGNNIANVNTCAFKSGSISFASVFSDSIGSIGGGPGNEEGNGVQVVGLNSVWEPGALESTMNSTDIAIQGDGFFAINNGTAADTSTGYTRAGQFGWNNLSQLTDPNGQVVQGFAWNSGGSVWDVTGTVDIDIDAASDPAPPATVYSDLQIESDGIITGINSTTSVRDNLYKIALHDFPNKDALRKVTGNEYQASNDSGAAVIYESGDPGVGTILSRQLEMSNVDLAKEFVDLIISQKAFQANSRVISSSADMLSEVINIIR